MYRAIIFDVDDTIVQSSSKTLRSLCRLMAGYLAEAVGLLPRSESCRYLYTNDGKGLPEGLPAITGVTFSGGVADFVYSPSQGDLFRFGDIGVILGDEIRKQPAFSQVKLYTPAETIRATVVGAGTCATEISGSTIAYTPGILPIQNIPILRVPDEDEATPERVERSIKFQLPLFMPEGRQEQIAISLSGDRYKSFSAVQRLAEAVISGARTLIDGPFPLIVVVETDIGKALGHALNVKLDHKKPVICIDGIHSASGDYICLLYTSRCV